jgi:hypothetical protein
MRRVRTSFIILAAVAAVTVTGCAAPAAWKRVAPDRPAYSGNLGITVDLPARWLYFEDKPSRSLLLTRYSAPMGFVHIVRRPLFAPLPYTALTINAGMQAYEAAEAAVGNLRATPGVFDLVTEALTPAEIGGADAFELLVSYSMENGMRRRCLIYGFIVNDKYYAELGLYALEDYYFEASLGEFLELVESVRVR